MEPKLPRVAWLRTFNERCAVPKIDPVGVLRKVDVECKQLAHALLIDEVVSKRSLSRQMCSEIRHRPLLALTPWSTRISQLVTLVFYVRNVASVPKLHGFDITPLEKSLT